MRKDLNDRFTDLTGLTTLGAETSWDPDQGLIHIEADGGTDRAFTVSYITRDRTPDIDFWKDDEARGRLDLFRSAADRDATMTIERRAKRLALVVDHHRHGDEHFSVSNTRSYLHGQWDTAPRGVFVPCDDAQKAYWRDVRAANRIGEPVARDAALFSAMAKVVEDSNAILNAYSDFVNGEVYGLIKESWIVDEHGRARMTDAEECWGIIGHAAAMERLQSGLRPEAEPEREALTSGF
ncbi:hypothetical protein [Paracoccus sp. ME4]|uniref:hypothetical protein n=1 Tax=Paracoccus sp. ME4 TaxID=3138066 RepID=UPI00398B71E5